MNDFDNLLSSSDFGFKPQGKSAPMKPSSSSSSSRATADPPKFDDFDNIFSGSGGGDGGSARYSSKSENRSSVDIDSMFSGGGSKHSSLPVFDKPVYDDEVDIFEGVPGLRSSASAKFDEFNVFGVRDKKKDEVEERGAGGGFDDLLGGFGKKESGTASKGSGGFDDLLGGFGSQSSPLERSNSESIRPEEPVASGPKTSSSAMEDPFSVFESSKPAAKSSSGLFTDPLEDLSKLSNSRSSKFDDSSAPSKGVYDDMDPFDGLGTSVPSFSSEGNNRGKDKSPSRTEYSRTGSQAYAKKDPLEKQSARSPDSHLKKNMYADSDSEPHQTLFDMPSVSTDPHKSAGQTFSPPSSGATSNGANDRADTPESSEGKESTDDVWLTVSEIPLYTQPTSAPPPSRPPPPIPVKKKVNTSFSKSTTSFQSPRSATAAARSSVTSVDELEEFAMGRSRSTGDDYANGFSTDDLEMNSVAAASAAAMKEAMDRAEAKFRHAREARERDNTRAARSKESVQVEKDDERAFREKQRLDHEQLQREREEEEREWRRLEKEREERESEQRRLEKERERSKEIERERARQAVERATREARERAAAEARLRAERAAVEKATAGARERAERAAVQRAQAEARARAAADAKERAEKAAADARERERAAAEARERERERAAAEARERAEARARAERAAVERAAAEARERAAAGARERAAAAAKANQQKNDNDLESFFSMGRASSAPRPRPNPSDPFETHFQSRQGPEPPKTSAASSTNIRKASSTTNIVDDLSSIFGAAPSSGEFQDIDGESEERRRARLERHQRTQERAAKALAEKNQRDLQVQREQAERHRIAETLDAEIRRWAAGKEGNLRALLSTLQYVLWPECGWQPVSLTDLITAAAVKKSYRKATLCIHPDKVQQKGANLQQKYIAEKVFDLLKEAWNKFNSEELF